MSSSSERSTVDQTRTYDRAGSVVFLKTHEAFGGLSNMAGGFPLLVQGVHIHTSEALYQACRFPHLPDVQRLIIGQASPMTAKMKSKPHRQESRADWDRVRVKVMRWCLRVKLVQNWEQFSQLLLRTGDRPIVEESRKDDFWGAKPVDEQTLVGMNVLGRLLMELREAVRSQGREAFQLVRPPAIPDFKLFGRQIDAIGVLEPVRQSTSMPTPSRAANEALQKQASLFKAPVARDGQLTAYGADELRDREPLSNLAPYPTVKDSGVQWLGDVPPHWERRRLKSLLRVIDRRSSTGTETLLSLRRDHGIVVYAEHFSRPAQGATTVGYKIVNKGQLVVNRLQANNGLVFDSSLDGLVSPDYSVFEHRGTDQILMPYLSLLLRTPTYRDHFRRESTGLGTGSAGFLRLYDDRFLETPVVLPPIGEQAAILQFLGHADRRIRRYIRSKLRLITLLEEQVLGTALAAMRRPEITVQRLSRVCTQQLRPVERSGEEFYIALGLKNRGRGIFHKHPRVGNDLGDSEFFQVEPGDLVISGQFAWEGAVAIASSAERECIVSHRYYLLRGIEGVATTEYLHALLRSDYGAMLLDHHSRGAAGRNRPLNLGTLLKEKVPVPPYRVQLDLGDLVLSLSPIRDRIQRQLDRLRELRTRLIADVVTGKVDVREAATRLPEVEEPDEGDELDTEADIEESSDEVDAVATEAEA
jgi:type I restriction enzyme S subunit